jgi:hypothetical protein
MDMRPAREVTFVLPHFESTDNSSLIFLLQILMFIFNVTEVHLLGFCQLWHDEGYCRYSSCSLNLPLDILVLICARYQMFTKLKE